MSKRLRRRKCLNNFCPNTYTDVIGATPDHSAVCVPCFYAEQALDQGRTIDDVSSVPHLREAFLRVLSMNGWTWSDFETSYQRMELRRKSPVHAMR